MTLYPKMIMDALATVTYAGTKKNLVESGMVADQPAIDSNNNKVTVVLEFLRDTDPFLKSTVKAADTDGIQVEATSRGGTDVAGSEEYRRREQRQGWGGQEHRLCQPCDCSGATGL